MLNRLQGAWKALTQPQTVKYYGSNTSGYDGFGYYGGYGRNGNFSYSEQGIAKSYMVVDAVRAGIDVYAYNYGSIPSRIINTDGEVIARSTDVVPTHPLYVAFDDYERYAKRPFQQTIAYYYTLFDEIYTQFLWNRYGIPKGLHILNNMGIYPYTDNGLIVYYDYSWDGNTRRFDVRDVAYGHGFNPFDDHRGASMVQSALKSVNIDNNIKDFILDFFANNARPGMIMSVEDTRYASNDDLWQTLKDQITEYHKGRGKQFNTFMSPIPLQITPLEQPQIQNQYAVKTEVKRDIFVSMGIPEGLVGGISSPEYESLRSTWITQHLQPRSQNILNYFNTLLRFFIPSGQRFEFDFSQFDEVSESDMRQTEVATKRVRHLGMSVSAMQAELGMNIDPDFEDIYMLPDGKPISKQLLLQIANDPTRFTGTPQITDRTAIGAPETPRQVRLEDDNRLDSMVDGRPDEMRDDDIGMEGHKALDVQRPAYAYIPLSNNDQIIKIVRDIKSKLQDKRIEWQSAPTYHVTLCYADYISDDAIDCMAKLLRVDPVALNGLYIDYFDTPDGKALHIRLENTAGLDALQAHFYENFEDYGDGLSEFSNPQNYNPHITLAYLPNDIEWQRQPVTFNAIAEQAIIGRDDYEPYAIFNCNHIVKAAPANTRFSRITYNGVTVEASPVQDSSRDDKKFMRWVRHNGRERLVHWGQPGEQMERDNPDAREAFNSRHSCSTKKDPFSPGFWACWAWQPDSPVRSLALDDLGKWERKALNFIKADKPHRMGEFESPVIDPLVMASVRGALQTATDMDTIALIFADAQHAQAEREAVHA